MMAFSYQALISEVRVHRQALLCPMEGDQILPTMLGRLYAPWCLNCGGGAELL